MDTRRLKGAGRGPQIGLAEVQEVHKVAWGRRAESSELLVAGGSKMATSGAVHKAAQGRREKTTRRLGRHTAKPPSGFAAAREVHYEARGNRKVT